MMVVKFNKFERVAGIFVLAAIIGSLLTAFSVAVKQGWFETKVYFSTSFENADGIHPGTTVQMAGLRAGSVDDVELQADNRIKVHFYVHSRFVNRVREDSSCQLIRPFIIGDRVLEVSVGTEALPALAENGNLKSEESMDLMTLISGKKMGSYLSKMGQIMENMHEVLTAFSNRDRTQSIVKIFDKMDPLVTNLNTMSTEVIKLSRQVTHDDNVQKVMGNAATLTHELNLILPELNRQNPQLAQDLSNVTKNLAQMTNDLKVIGPAVSAVGADLPVAAKRAVEVLNEVTVLVKAMEKSMFVRGSVADVREEEAKDAKRSPAGVKKPSSNAVNACESVK